MFIDGKDGFLEILFVNKSPGAGLASILSHLYSEGGRRKRIGLC